MHKHQRPLRVPITRSDEFDFDTRNSRNPRKILSSKLMIEANFSAPNTDDN